MYRVLASMPTMYSIINSIHKLEHLFQEQQGALDSILAKSLRTRRWTANRGGHATMHTVVELTNYPMHRLFKVFVHDLLVL